MAHYLLTPSPTPSSVPSSPETPGQEIIESIEVSPSQASDQTESTATPSPAAYQTESTATPSPAVDEASSTPSSTPQRPQSVPASSVKFKCDQCSTWDAIPVQAVIRLSEGTVGAKYELFEKVVEGIGLRDRRLCSGCFMRAKTCYAFQRRFASMKYSLCPLRTDAEIITAAECFECFEVALVTHLQRIKGVDELIKYVHGLAEQPSVGVLGAAAVFCPPPSMNHSPIQLADLLALKEASDNYIKALGKTGVTGARDQRFRTAHFTNRLLEGLMRIPPVGVRLGPDGQPATNATGPYWPRFYCRICRWCRSSRAQLESIV
ncbi:hypothetical protein B0T20DRAFT_363578 [Sordaria brevicollis]|uniref:Uncharacterized protein n=1 Tax=Sordaria brevicollis TaxID=83679 RepID=A0AAE0NW20_SORBR|nr:hypothetical protein B0T20DRAFT_363578 [Sordaria brevicollis]